MDYLLSWKASIVANMCGEFTTGMNKKLWSLSWVSWRGQRTMLTASQENSRSSVLWVISPCTAREFAKCGIESWDQIHFYVMSTIWDTIFRIYHMFVASKNIMNTKHTQDVTSAAKAGCSHSLHLCQNMGLIWIFQWHCPHHMFPMSPPLKE